MILLKADILFPINNFYNNLFNCLLFYNNFKNKI